MTRRLVRQAGVVSDEICESDRVSVPMTVGSLRPRILLPAGWRNWDQACLRAVLAHERAHVRRGDFAIAVAAAVNRSVFWFHPLAWWLERTLAALAEEACDDAAVLETGERAPYAEVLVRMAAAVRSSGGRLIWHGVGMAKLKEVHMRIDRILDETRPIAAVLSLRRRVGLLLCGVPLMYAAAALQLAPALAQQGQPAPSKDTQAPPPAAENARPAPAPEPVQAAPAPVRKPKAAAAQDTSTQTQPSPARPAQPTLVRRVEPEYPPIARRTGARGTVDMSVTVAPDGHVTAVKVLSGHPMLVSAAVEAVRQWIYTEQPAESTIGVKLNFAGDASSPNPEGQIRPAVLISRRDPVYPEEARQAGARGTVTLSATIGVDGHVTEVQVIQGHPLLQAAAVEAVKQWTYRPSVLTGKPVETKTQIVLNFVGEAPRSGSFEKAELISRIEPVHPGGELQHLAGTIVFRATVGVDGRLSNIRAVDGPAELVPAALDAVRQWVYRPSKLNGRPVETETQIALRFEPQN